MVHQQGVNDVAWDPQGKYLATVSDDLRILIWDVETGQALRCMKGHSNYIYCCKFDPVGHLLVRRDSSRPAGCWGGRGAAAATGDGVQQCQQRRTTTE
jgi:COMPASS component SWD3